MEKLTYISTTLIMIVRDLKGGKACMHMIEDNIMVSVY